MFILLLKLGIFLALFEAAGVFLQVILNDFQE